MWLIARYEAVTLFSLKPGSATSSGGRSLLAPTPFSLKMALLDATYGTRGMTAAEEIWSIIRDGDVALSPSAQAVATNLFQRVMKPTRADAKDEDEVEEAETATREAFTRTIGYREYVHMSGAFDLAFSVPELHAHNIENLFQHIHYVGKRGGFIQMIQAVSRLEELPENFIVLTQLQTTFAFDGVMQIMDDCGKTLSLEKANIYNAKKRVALGKDRIQRRIVLPYQAVRSARSYTLYERID